MFLICFIGSLGWDNASWQHAQHWTGLVVGCCWHAEKLPGSEPCRAMALFTSHSPKSWFSTTPSSSILQITLYDWCKDRLGLPGQTRNLWSNPMSQLHQLQQLQSCKIFITTFQINGRDFSHPWFKMQSSPSCTTISFDKWSEATFHNFFLLWLFFCLVETCWNSEKRSQTVVICSAILCAVAAQQLYCRNRLQNVTEIPGHFLIHVHYSH